MTMFWVTATVMLLIAVAFVLSPLVKQNPLSDLRQDKLNLDLARERLQEWRTALEKEVISQAEFDDLRSELEGTLILELGVETPLKTNRYRRSYSVIALAVALPIAVIGIYLHLGTSTPLLSENLADLLAGRQNTTLEPPALQVEEMLTKLQDHLKTNPNDERGWSILAHALMSLKRYPDAVQAYEGWLRLAGKRPDVLVLYANALAMAADGNMTGQPTILLEEALSTNPLQPRGLWLSGIAARQRGDLDQALAYWYRLKPLLGEQSQSHEDLQRMIAQTETDVLASRTAIPYRSETLVAEQPFPSRSHPVLNVRVEIDAKLFPLLSDRDVLFVYARVAGATRPIAAIRQAITPWPIDVVLDSASSAMGSSPLSSFDVVEISAHVSRSGQAMAKTGDLTAKPVTTSVDDGAIVQIRISNVLP